MIILPRQARDEHTESTQKRCVFRRVVNTSLGVDNGEGEVSVVDLGASWVDQSHGQVVDGKRRVRIDDPDGALHFDLHRHSRNSTRLKADDKVRFARPSKTSTCTTSCNHQWRVNLV